MKEDDGMKILKALVQLGATESEAVEWGALASNVDMHRPTLHVELKRMSSAGLVELDYSAEGGSFPDGVLLLEEGLAYIQDTEE